MEMKTLDKKLKYFCDNCHFTKDNKNDYNRHLVTRKHKQNIEGNKKLKKTLTMQIVMNVRVEKI